jgi:hypothetical protein
MVECPFSGFNFKLIVHVFDSGEFELFSYLNLRGLQVFHKIIVQNCRSDEVLTFLGLLVLGEGPRGQVLQADLFMND